MTVTADEINYLVHRYLEESGCPHTAFIFGSECRLGKANIQATQLPPQALLTILKKGMLYMQMEKGINEKAKTDDSPDSIVISITEAVRHEEAIIPAKTEEKERTRTIQNQKKQQENSRGIQQNVIKVPQIQMQEPAKPAIAPVKEASEAQPSSQYEVDFSAKLPPIPMPYEIPQSKSLILSHHTGDIYCGAWSYNGELFADGSSDATAVIWDIQNNQSPNYYVLDHAQTERKNKDIATLAWNPDGTLLATGCYDGTARLWTNRGELRFVLAHHIGPVFTVQFSMDGTYLLTGSSDSTIILWNAHTGTLRQVFQSHKNHVLDVDWRDNTIFASCSGDKSVIVWKVGLAQPFIIYEGHKGEVNKIAWDPTKTILASCSDDKTIRIWKPFEKSPHILLQGHTHHVYTIKWCPGNPNILASGAFDFTVRIWDVSRQQCLHCIQKHTQPIYTICFSPRGHYFVSGGIDTKLYIWRTVDAALVGIYDANSGMFEAHWDPTGKYIAMCLANAKVAIINTSDLLL